MLEVVYNRNNETDIWIEFQQGDRDAFNQIYSRYAETLLQYAYNFTFDNALAEDCLQELFVDLWRTRQNLTVPSSIKYYLIQSLRRRIIRKIKCHQNKLHFVENISNLKGINDFSFSIETHLIRSEEQVHQEKSLKQQLDKLSSVQREVIFHRFFGGLSIDDIAKMMELPKKSIYNALAKGISSLRKAFK